MRLIWRTVLLILACCATTIAPVAESLPRSVLILDQSATSSVWYAAFSPVFRSTLNAGSAKRISIYEEHLDLSRFGGPQHDELLRNYLREKFRGETDRLTGRPGVIIAGLCVALHNSRLGCLWFLQE